MVSIQLIGTGDPLYPSEQRLRNTVLLRPIGLPDHAWEMHDHLSWHFVAVENNTVTGCVVLRPLNKESGTAQLMQMAVEPGSQGKGTGALLVKALLAFCKTSGITTVICHSRDTAIPFYLRMGFDVYGDPFEEVGIPHAHMRIMV